MRILNRNFKLKTSQEIKTGLLMVVVAFVIFLAIKGSFETTLNTPIYEFIFTWLSRGFLFWFFVVDVLFSITKEEKDA